MINCNLTSTNLTGTYLGNANLSGANLTDAKLIGANLTKVDLTNTKLIGTKLIGANLTKVDLTDANLTNADLTNAELRSAYLEGANLEGANLEGANLFGADLLRANLTHATLIRTNLEGANLTGANLTDADLGYANLTSANLTGVNLTTVGTLYRADLSDIDFTEANLTGLDLTSTKLSDCDFRRANLTNTIFLGADISESIFSTTVTLERLAGTIGTPIFRDVDLIVETPQGIAYEIHNASNKYIDKCISIISPLVSIDSYFLGFPDIVNDFVKQQLNTFINSDKFTGNKEIILPKLDQILTKLNLSEISNEKKLVIGKSIDFVLKQSPEFINFYIDSFVQDCYHAYSGPNGISCVKGIYERFPMLIGPSALAMCPEISSCSNITYKQLIEAFELGKQIDFNSLLQEWSEQINNDPIDLTIDGLTLPDKKKLIKSNLINFIKDKYAEIGTPITEEEIIEKILPFEYIYDSYIQTNTISFGGFKRTNKFKCINKTKHVKKYKRINKTKHANKYKRINKTKHKRINKTKHKRINKTKHRHKNNTN